MSDIVSTGSAQDHLAAMSAVEEVQVPLSGGIGWVDDGLPWLPEDAQAKMLREDAIAKQDERQRANELADAADAKLTAAMIAGKGEGKTAADVLADADRRGRMTDIVEAKKSDWDEDA